MQDRYSVREVQRSQYECRLPHALHAKASAVAAINRYVLEVFEMEDRFEFVEKNGVMQGTRIIVDKETGVQYLLAHWTNIGGLTVLVDKDGKPLLDPRYAK